MLLRMYTKHALKQKWNLKILNILETPAGIKSVIVEFPHKAKTLIKSENGVHRLTRCSPFGNGKLQTSFASVCFTLETSKNLVSLPTHEVEEMFYRGSGPGGQNRNIESRQAYASGIERRDCWWKCVLNVHKRQIEI